MEALELLKTWKRICTEAELCVFCPVRCSLCWSKENDNTLEEMVQGIEKWAEEHPEKAKQGGQEETEI